MITQLHNNHTFNLSQWLRPSGVKRGSHVTAVTNVNWRRNYPFRAAMSTMRPAIKLQKHDTQTYQIIRITTLSAFIQNVIYKHVLSQTTERT